MAGEVITRAEAREQGIKRYFTALPCCRGHVAERLVSDCACVVCAALKQKERRERDPERAREIQKRHDAKRREKKAIADKERKLKNAGRIKEQKRAWKAKNADRVREQMRRWVEENREAVKKRKRADYHRHKGSIRERWREKYAASPEMREAAVAAASRRRARKLSAEGTHTPADLKRILEAQGHRCAYCGTDLRKAKKHIDHIMPLALGGSNAPSNLAYACAPCNLSKGARDPIDFAQERGLLL